MKTYTLIISLLLVSGNLFSQKDTVNINYEKEFKKAQALISKGEPENALPIFKEFLKYKPDNAHYNFKAGFLYYIIPGKRDSALTYLEKALKNISPAFSGQYNDSTAPIETWNFVGKIYHSNYMFEEAIEVLKKYKSRTSHPELIKEIEHEIEQCEFGQQLIMRPTDLAVMELGGGINTIYDEHSPVLTSDLKTIIFTSKRPGSTGGLRAKDGKYYEDIYIAHFENRRWSSPKKISKNINTNDHEASVGLSGDGKILYIYKDSNGGDIYESRKTEKDWTKPKALNKNINTRYHETHATISSDEKTLYFASNRPGGYGGMDLYYCEKQLEGWGKAVNMGPVINTSFDEAGPFIHPDGKTLFFSSKGHLGMGGLDLFTSVKKGDSTWSEPVNLGYPANSTNDDVFYVSSPGGNYGFYVSNQLGTSGSTNIYSMMLPDKYRKKVGVISGKVDLSAGFDELPDDKPVNIYVIDIQTHDTIRTYNSDLTGKFVITLPTNREFLISYEVPGQLTHTQEIKLSDDADLQVAQRIIPLQPVIKGVANEDYGITFITGTNSLDYKSKVKLTKASENLKTYSELVGEISVNEIDDLKKERTESVLDYLSKQNIDISKIKIIPNKYNYFEFLIADTLFLRYRDKDWTVSFEDSTAIPEVVSVHKMRELMYFIKRNPELYIEVPVIETNPEKTYFDRLRYVHDYFNENGIDTSRILAVKIPEGTPVEKCKINIKSKRGLEELLITVLNRMKNGEKKDMLSVPVMIHGIPNMTMEQAEYIKKYLMKRNIDTTNLILTTFKGFRTGYNLLRENLTNERDAGTLKSSNLYTEIERKGYVEILPSIIEKIGTEIYVVPIVESKEEVPEEQERMAYTNTDPNFLRLNLGTDRTAGLKLKRISFEIGDIKLTEQDCGYLFTNIHTNFFLIHFEFDKHTSSKIGGLDSISACLVKHPGVHLDVAGHTDSKGTNAYNDVLSEKRAKFVKTYMLQRGVRTNQLDSKGYSENVPTAPNSVNGEDFKQGRAQNRRVELRVDYIDPELEKGN